VPPAASTSNATNVAGASAAAPWGGQAALQRHEVQPTFLAHDKFTIEHHVAGEPGGDRGDDLGEVSGEGAVLAGVQPHPPRSAVAIAPEPVELGLERPRPCRGQVGS
jgi:hypothetical protein